MPRGRVHAQFATLGLVGALLLTAVAGCKTGGAGGKSGGLGGLHDPFMGSKSTGGGLALASLDDKDKAREVSTSPATDPMLGGPPTESPAPKESAPPAEKSRPLIDATGKIAQAENPTPPNNKTDEIKPDADGVIRDHENTDAHSKQEFAGGTVASADQADEPKNDYQVIRKRLEKLGVSNIRLHRDERGLWQFYCERPWPQQPDRVRVFECWHTNDLKAMEAVADSVDQWLAEQQVSPSN